MKMSHDYHYIKMVVRNWVSPKSKKKPRGIVTQQNLCLLNKYFATTLQARTNTNLGTIRTSTPWDLVRLTWKRPLPTLSETTPTKSMWIINGRFKTRVGTDNYKIKTLWRPLDNAPKHK